MTTGTTRIVTEDFSIQIEEGGIVVMGPAWSSPQHARQCRKARPAGDSRSTGVRVEDRVNGEAPRCVQGQMGQNGEKGQKAIPAAAQPTRAPFRDRRPWRAPLLLVRVAGVLNSAGLVLDVALGKPLLDAVLFTLAIAVGIISG